jgi:hypothetical protein
LQAYWESEKTLRKIHEKWSIHIGVPVNFTRYNKIILAICIFIGWLTTAIPAISADKMIVGWLEMVRIYPENLNIKAKLDSGAKTSSLNAALIEELERDGKKWVRFRVTDHKGKKLILEKKISRVAKIKLRNKRLQKRPVIIMDICLGGIHKEVEVNLVDRSYFNYQMLLGRSFLAGTFLVDSASKYTTKPDCRKDGKNE